MFKTVKRVSDWVFKCEDRESQTVNAPYAPHRVARDNVLMGSVAFCQFRSPDAKTRVHSRVID